MKRIIMVGWGLAALALILFISAAVGYRADVCSWSTAWILTRLCGTFSVLSVGVCLFAAMTNREKRNRRSGRQAWGAILAATLLAGIAYQATPTAVTTTKASDVTTDRTDPPQFRTFSSLHSTPTELAAPPEIQSKLLIKSPMATYELALTIAKFLKWDIVNADPQGLQIEATQSSFWFGHKDDIVIRVSPEGRGSRLDLRSAARQATSDAGRNTERIKKFLIYLPKD